MCVHIIIYLYPYAEIQQEMGLCIGVVSFGRWLISLSKFEHVANMNVKCNYVLERLMAADGAHYSSGFVRGRVNALMPGLHFILLYFSLLAHHGNISCLSDCKLCLFTRWYEKSKLNNSLNCIGNTAYTVMLLFAVVIYNLAWGIAWLYGNLQLIESVVIFYSWVRSI